MPQPHIANTLCGYPALHFTLTHTYHPAVVFCDTRGNFKHIQHLQSFINALSCILFFMKHVVDVICGILSSLSLKLKWVQILKTTASG